MVVEPSPDDVAIIGMVGRFPGADTLEEFWQLIRSGNEAVTFFSETELEALGVDPALLRSPRYVKAGPIIQHAQWFDAAFFGFSPREAEIIDPQQRMFLECAWAALEDAGYDPEKYKGQIGVYAGATSSNYLLNVYANQEVVQTMGYFQISLATEKDHLPMRVSYKLNLKGPSINVQTACSTSLVAVHLACEGLLNRQCDMALAGAVTLRMPQGVGYEYEPGGVASADGHCRPFAADATGTVFGNGLGIVVLKRLEDALLEKDHIYAVIKSSAINNDGALKIGYTAPSVEGQAAVITEALALANVEPETINYIEAHGTGTPLGDPIEITALTQAFRSSTMQKGFCALGAVKANVGHLESASGMAGLIKTVLALKHKMFPPQANFASANPSIDFASSPFYVNTSLKEWPRGSTPRRAGVSSFGMGGTNAHIILEEAPQAASLEVTRPYHLLLLSARSSVALEAARTNLAAHIDGHPEENIADVAFTLQMGRRVFPHRQMLVCSDLEDGLQALTSPLSTEIHTGIVLEEKKPLVFMFPGQGSQYVNMAHNLYETESSFRGQIDYCSRFLKTHIGLDLRTILYPKRSEEQDAEVQLQRTALTQPVLFIIEYALAKLWLSWGLKPQALIGHSIGEYVAACLAGVFSLEDALMLVAARGQLIQQLAPGAMLSLPLTIEEVTPYLDAQLSLAAVNGPALTVVSGPQESITALEKRLSLQGTEYRRLHTSHAFHSKMLDPMLTAFKIHLQRVSFHAPNIPYISNVTATWVTEQDVLNPEYWVRQLRQTVLFAAGIETLIENKFSAFLEVGPGHTLGAFVHCQKIQTQTLTTVSSLRHVKETQSDVKVLITALGKLWLSGIEINWEAFYGQEQRQRVSLPAYPFERQPYYIELLPGNVTNWSWKEETPFLYSPSWKRGSACRLTARQEMLTDKRTWIIFANHEDLSTQIIRRLTSLGHTVIPILNSENSVDYQALSQKIHAYKDQPLGIVCFWETSCSVLSSLHELDQLLEDLQLAQSIPVWVIGQNHVAVEGTDAVTPPTEQVLYDCVQLLQQTGFLCRYIDITPVQDAPTDALLLEQLTGQLLSTPSSGLVALRGRYCWEYTFTPIVCPSARPVPVEGVYLIHNLTNSIAFSLATYLARYPKTRLALLVPTDLPPMDRWDTWLDQSSETTETSMLIRKIQTLQKSKQDLLLIRGDLATSVALAQAISEITRDGGELHGIILTLTAPPDASETDSQSIVTRTNSTLQDYAALLSDVAAEFCLLCGMTDSPVGKQAIFSSLLLDSFTLQQNETARIHWLSLRRDNMVCEATSEEMGRQQEGIIARILQSDHQALEGPLVFSPGQILHTLFDCRFGQTLAIQPEPASHAPFRSNMQADFVVPGTTTQRSLASIWEHLLGIEQIAIGDNFFELGGHSLLATQIIARVREAFHIELAVRDIFEAPTIAQMALLVEEKKRVQETSQLPEIGTLARPKNIPASFAQRQLWFFDQLEISSSVYNIPTAVRLKGPLRVEILAQILNEIIRRHEVLRTTFALIDNQVVQVISEHGSLTVDQIDLRTLPTELLDKRVKDLLLADASKPFHLKTGPLIRATLLVCSPEEHILILTLHHIVSDAWSLGIIVHELAALYEAFQQGKPSPLAQLPFQYADVALWQLHSLQQPTLKKALEYWTKQLSGSPPYLALPFDRPRPPLQTFHGNTVSFVVPAHIALQLTIFSRKEEKTLFVCLLAAFNMLLFYYTGQQDLNVGTAVANRTHVDMERLIGFFVDTVVLRTNLSANPTFREIVERVDSVVKGAQTQQGIPFEYLVDALKIARNPAYSPLFQHAFVMQNTPESHFTLSELVLEALKIDISTGSARFDLLLDMGEAEGQLVGFFEYNTDLFNHTTIMQMIDLFQLLLASITANPDTNLLEMVDVLAKYVEDQQQSKKASIKQERIEKLKQVRRQAIDI